jgi:hypothetical protein
VDVRLAALASAIAGTGTPVGGATQAAVMRAIAQGGGRLPRRDIARRLGLSAGTLSKAVAHLAGLGLVEEGVGQAVGPGRPSVPVRFGGRYVAMGSG